eukprot:TRINITY_DN32467_c0_g1_i1.p1 TRINITY_DN32467_c0_g1~~TRINITY_DN32467_c0_g1_i1.p1  ORF type:complete len:267 (-),score=81.33 TRINITY_DN32467_c0_g1_i1:148-948(-)
MQLFVKTLTASTITIEAEPTDTIGMCKERTANHSILAEKQRWIRVDDVEGIKTPTILRDSHTLEEYGIDDEHNVVHMLLKIRNFHSELEVVQPFDRLVGELAIMKFIPPPEHNITLIPGAQWEWKVEQEDVDLIFTVEKDDELRMRLDHQQQQEMEDGDQLLLMEVAKGQRLKAGKELDLTMEIPDRCVTYPVEAHADLDKVVINLMASNVWNQQNHLGFDKDFREKVVVMWWMNSHDLDGDWVEQPIEVFERIVTYLWALENESS